MSERVMPHPDDGYLPQCEWGHNPANRETPCQREAAVKLGHHFYCDPHASLWFAMTAEDEANEAVTYARRYLWSARERGLETLMGGLQTVVEQAEDNLQRVQQDIARARQKAESSDEHESGADDS